MEAAVRAFEDWEFRVLERESGMEDEDEEGESGESQAEVGRAVSCQQHVVDATQVNGMNETDVDSMCRSESLFWCVSRPRATSGA